MIRKDHVKKVVDEILEGTEIFPVELIVRSDNRISVIIDGDQGVTINNCQEVSRKIETQLDRDTEDYELNVSSAGLDRPITLIRQYKKNIGRKLEILNTDGNKIEGTLISVTESGVEINCPVIEKKKIIGNQITELPFSNIQTTKVKIEFKK